MKNLVTGMTNKNLSLVWMRNNYKKEIDKIQIFGISVFLKV